MSIQIFITGGTFDKEYNEITGKLYFKDTHLKEMLSMGRSQLDVKITTLMMIDSIDMTNDDRDNILEACKNCLLDKIIITHGTDTMIDTAKFLAKDNIDKNFSLASANIPNVYVSTVEGINVKDMLKSEKLFILKNAISSIHKRKS